MGAESTLKQDLEKATTKEEIRTVKSLAETLGHTDVVKMAKEKLEAISAKAKSAETIPPAQVAQVESMGGSADEVAKRTEGVDVKIAEVKKQTATEIAGVKGDVTAEEVPKQEDVVKDKELSEKAKGYLKSYFQVPDSSVEEKRAIQGMEKYSASSITKSRTEAAQNNLSLSIELERVKDKSEQNNQLLNQARRVYLNQTGGRDKFVPITKETVFESGARNFRVLQIEDVEKLVNLIKGVIGELRGEKSVNGTTIAEKIGTLTDEDRKEIIDHFSSKLPDAEKSLGIVLALEKDLESGYKSNLEEGVVVSSKYDESLSRLGVSLEKAEERLQLPSTFKHY